MQTRIPHADGNPQGLCRFKCDGLGAVGRMIIRHNNFQIRKFERIKSTEHRGDALLFPERGQDNGNGHDSVRKNGRKKQEISLRRDTLRAF